MKNVYGSNRGTATRVLVVKIRKKMAAALYSKSPPAKNSYLCFRLAQFIKCPVSSFENNKKITSNAGCSFLYVNFLMAGTHCTLGSRENVL